MATTNKYWQLQALISNLANCCPAKLSKLYTCLVCWAGNYYCMSYCENIQSILADEVIMMELIIGLETQLSKFFVGRTQDHRNFWNITTSKICFRMLSAIGGKECLAKLLPQPTRGHLTTWNVRIVFSITGTSRSQLKRGKTCLLFFLIWVLHRLLLYMLSTSCKIVIVSLWSSPQFPVAFWILSRKKSKWSYYKSYQSIFLSLHSRMVYSDMTHLLFPPQRPVSPS